MSLDKEHGLGVVGVCGCGGGVWEAGTEWRGGGGVACGCVEGEVCGMNGVG